MAATEPPPVGTLEARREDGSAVSQPLKAGGPLVVGRGTEAGWRIEGEPFLSRRHFSASVLMDGRLLVKRLEGTKNPIFVQGVDKAEFHLDPGEHFVIGGTRFLFLAAGAVPKKTEPPSEPHPQHMETVHDRDLYSLGASSERMRLRDLLELPEILRSSEPGEFFVHVAALLRMATGAQWAAVLRWDGEQAHVLAEDAGRDHGLAIRPSRRLIQKAVATAPLPTVYQWERSQKDLQMSLQEGIDWALCAAAKIPGSSDFAFYAAGSGGAAAAHRDNSRFVGLVADMVGRSLSVRELQGMTDRLGHFFSPRVTQAILKEPGKLEQRVAQSTVMFFDIRGFSKMTEDKTEKILEHSKALLRAMTALTEEIHQEEGAVLQYLGDGILACWNVPLEDPRHVDRACRAALRMKDRLAEATGGWRCGIGLHTGEVVAGAIGSEQVFSYGLMGAVVNQASRIEGITKVVRHPVVCSREVAQALSPEAAATLRLGRYQPAGMNAATDLYAVLSPPGDPARAAVFQEGLAALEKGDWAQAYKLFHKLPDDDEPAQYLMHLAGEHKTHPPKDWRGVIELSAK